MASGQRIDISDPTTSSARKKAEPEFTSKSAASKEDKAKMLKIVASIGMLVLAGLITAYTQGVFDPAEPTYTPTEDAANTEPAPKP